MNLATLISHRTTLWLAVGVFAPGVRARGQVVHAEGPSAASTRELLRLTPSAPREQDRADLELDSLVALALAANPGLRAARSRVDGARARIAPAGARPDPMLMAGLQNQPVTTAASDPMTMRMVGLSQMFPYPGKLSLRTRTARDEFVGTEADLEAARLDVVAQVKREYYELAYIDRALDVVERTRSVLANLVTVADAHYSAGSGSQADVLRARVEAAHLAEQASDLQEQRRAGLARVNAALDRPSETPIEHPSIPERVARAAAPDSAAHVRFASAALGARVADSPIVPLDALQALAVEHSPMLRAHESRIAAQRARVDLARKAHLPDIDVGVSYGQRPGRPDMITATVSVPLPIQRARKQDAERAAASADLAALEAEHRAVVNGLNADVAQRVSELERARTQLSLSVRAILPQAQASLTSATSGYQVGRVDFTAVMDAQATVFNGETAYYRSLADFAKGLAELERTVGAGVLR